MNVKGKNYGSKDEMFVIELPAREYMKIHEFVPHSAKFTQTAKDMFIRWSYANGFIRPGSIEASMAWQKHNDAVNARRSTKGE